MHKATRSRAKYGDYSLHNERHTSKANVKSAIDHSKNTDDMRSALELLEIYTALLDYQQNVKLQRKQLFVTILHGGSYS